MISGDPVDTYVGRRIRERRKIVGFTQQKLAEKLGISFQQVQKYEKGLNRVGVSRLVKLSAALNVPISYFFVGSGTNGERDAAKGKPGH